MPPATTAVNEDTTAVNVTATGVGCLEWCANEYRLGRRPPECGYWRHLDPTTGRPAYDNRPVAQACPDGSAQRANQRDVAFELESATQCELWNRAFTRADLVRILGSALPPADFAAVSGRTKKELCDMLHDNTISIYKELDAQVSGWCKDLSADLASPEMAEVFRTLNLPPPATYGTKNAACAAMVARLAAIKPPWYARAWNSLKSGTRAVWQWITRNPGKSLVLAASFIAAVYAIPYAVAVVTPYVSSGWLAAQSAASAVQAAAQTGWQSAQEAAQTGWQSAQQAAQTGWQSAQGAARTGWQSARSALGYVNQPPPPQTAVAYNAFGRPVAPASSDAVASAFAPRPQPSSSSSGARTWLDKAQSALGTAQTLWYGVRPVPPPSSAPPSGAVGQPGGLSAESAALRARFDDLSATQRGDPAYWQFLAASADRLEQLEAAACAGRWSADPAAAAQFADFQSTVRRLLADGLRGMYWSHSAQTNAPLYNRIAALVNNQPRCV